MKELYLIYHCDLWQSRSSFLLIGVVEKDKLQSALAKIKKECEYTDEDMEDYITYNKITLNELDI